MRKCELCGKEKDGVTQPSGTFLCDPCQKKIVARQEASKEVGMIKLDSVELWKLKADGFCLLKGMCIWH